MMLTSNERAEDIGRCGPLGISACVTKPVRRAKLRSAVRAALAKRGEGEAREQSADLAVLASGIREPHDGMRILLAEDNVVNQRVALRILEKAGHSVVLARDGVEAVEKFNGQKFDLVFMDVQMPEMSGIEATARIRKTEAGLRTPNVALTAHAMSGDQQRCLDAGMDDYLSKPIRASTLIALITDIGSSREIGLGSRAARIIGIVGRLSFGLLFSVCSGSSKMASASHSARAENDV